MLKRLRRQFVCIIMLIVTLMLAAIMVLLLSFTERSLDSQAETMLRSAVNTPMERQRPGDMPSGFVRLDSFTLTELPDGELMVSGGESFDLSDEDYLAALFEAASARSEESGLLKDFALRYVKVHTPMGEQIAFAETNREQEVMTHLGRSCLLIGAAALLVFFFISLLLARWTVRPVEKAWQQQRQFVADASHELKTPLTVILTNAELLQGEEDEKSRQELSSSLLIMARQMRSLVERLLELARSDNGQHREREALFDLSHMVEERIMSFEPLLFESGLFIESEVEPDISLRGREQELSQVVDVLLDNAGKYGAAPGTVHLTLLRRDSRHCVLTVDSPGTPLGSEDCEKIFERFYRVDSSRSRGGGFGLGLSIARELVQGHGGSISAKALSEGNRFTVELPIKG